MVPADDFVVGHDKVVPGSGRDGDNVDVWFTKGILRIRDKTTISMWCSMKQNICLTVATNTIVGLIHHNEHKLSFPCCRIYLVNGLAKVKELLTCLAVLKLAGSNNPFLDILFDIIKQFPLVV